MGALVDVQGLFFSYGHHGRQPDQQSWVLNDVSLSIQRTTTLGIVGESGSGKSTLVRVLCGLLPFSKGSVSYEGQSVSEVRTTADFRRQNQIVFQSPASSLDPRMKVGRSLAEPVRSLEGRKPSKDEVEGWLNRVGLGSELLSRYPHQMSGGQLQRVAIARALSVSPQVLYADEPTSALDVSIQAQVLNLLMDLRAQLGLTLVMVSHDLAVISRLCDHIVVMQNGRIVEVGEGSEVLRSPQEAYTASLIDAAKTVSLGARNRI